MRLRNRCITRAQGPSRTCNESKEEEEEKDFGGDLEPEGVDVPLLHPPRDALRVVAQDEDVRGQGPGLGSRVFRV